MKTGQLWAYAREDRPWQGADPPGIVYVYAPDRKSERPMTHLNGFVGILQVDGHRGGYRALAAGNSVSLAFCRSRVRRRGVSFRERCQRKGILTFSLISDNC